MVLLPTMVEDRRQEKNWHSQQVGSAYCSAIDSRKEAGLLSELMAIVDDALPHATLVCAKYDLWCWDLLGSESSKGFYPVGEWSLFNPGEVTQCSCIQKVKCGEQITVGVGV